MKPENLFLTSDGNVLLGDLGAAKDVVNTEVGATDLGTYNYMAPESLTGLEKTTKKADVWGLGCVLFELAIAGR